MIRHNLRSPLRLLAAVLILALAGIGNGVAQPIPGPNQSAGVTVRILPHAEVLGGEFTVGEVAELDGAALETVRRIANISLGRSPMPGRTLRLSESFLRARIAQMVDPESVQLDVPEGAEVLRASQVVVGTEISQRVLDAAAQEAGGLGGDVEQTLSTPIADVTLPVGEIAWIVEPMGRRLSAGGSRTYRVEAHVQGAIAWRTVVRVQQDHYREVAVASQAIGRNQVIQARDVRMERQSVVGLKPSAYVTRVADLVGARAKRPIGRGERIQQVAVASVADIAEGGPVLLVYQTRQVRFSVPGVALVPAKIGQYVPARNLQTGKIVYGVVQPDESLKVN